MAKFDSIFKAEVKKTEQHPRRDTKWLHYSKLVDNPAQYCNERDLDEIIALAGLIDADKGVIQNLLVRKIDADQYEIIAGHKRRRACKYLVEVENKPEYAFVPCTVESLSDVRAEFQLYSSNGFHPKNEYEIMHELERMKYLLENYPEEFPHLQTGRMVERLAKQLNMKRTTVGEYLTISKNLGEKGKEAFKSGELKKSAALEISSLEKEEQDKLLDSGITSQKEIKAYKGTKVEKITQRKTVTDSFTRLQINPEEHQEVNPEVRHETIPGQCRIVDTEMSIEEEPVVELDPDLGQDQPKEPVSYSTEQDTEEDVVPESGTQEVSADQQNVGLKFENSNPTETEKLLFRYYGFYLIESTDNSMKYAPIHTDGNGDNFPDVIENISSEMIEWDNSIIFNLMSETVRLSSYFDIDGIILIQKRMEELGYRKTFTANMGKLRFVEVEALCR